MKSIVISLRVLLLGALGIQLGACSSLFGEEGMFRDRGGDYLEAPVTPQMRVPENLDSFTLDQLYVVPDQTITAGDDLVGAVPRPKPLDTNRPEGVVIRRYSGENWILIAATPGQVWPRIRDYWNQRGVELDYENPVDGIMETDWLDTPSNPGSREKFRLRIEPGLRSGSSEIILVQISRPQDEVDNGLVIWPRLSDSEEREFAMLQEVSQYLADRTDIYSSSSSSLLAGSIQGAAKASLIDDRSAGPVLQLRISMSRAWVQIGQALEQAEVEILTSDRDSAVFQVAFDGLNTDQDRPGFFRRMFTNDDQDQDATLPSFRIQLEESSTGIQVTASQQGGDAGAAGLDAELLQAILNNLS